MIKLLPLWRVLQRWDIGADRIPDLKIYRPTPIARMTALLFSEEGVCDPDIRARIEHESSIFVFEERRGKAPSKRPAPEMKEVMHVTWSSEMDNSTLLTTSPNMTAPTLRLRE